MIAPLLDVVILLLPFMLLMHWFLTSVVARHAPAGWLQLAMSASATAFVVVGVIGVRAYIGAVWP